MAQLDDILKNPTAWNHRFGATEMDDLRIAEAAEAVISLVHVSTGNYFSVHV